ncbi:SGNH/GDSL hydrolase family protein [Aureispira sp. CCB-QB1]|uniref:SGNH/GDSL hydrolase family protein n=1 Tax=Aureispira sp. CCB-QB1 TaxID=1313421 RepID=UPI000697F0FB|nr:SGNH/GDSL hydrolase family protein [Aureispira sp. CCB-QB1]
MKHQLLLFCFIVITINSCTIPPSSLQRTQDKPAALSYLALGDSYTIGESITSNQRWPILLTEALQTKGYTFQTPDIIAQTGWRTDHLLNAMQEQLSSSQQYDLVSILIGVNNQFQNTSIQKYEQDLKILFDQAISQCKTGRNGVFVLSIPDYGATPYGLPRAKQIGKAIDEWNAVYQKIATMYQLPWFDITPISRTATKEKELIAKDGLHPSGKMYQLWVDAIVEKVIDCLK